MSYLELPHLFAATANTVGNATGNTAGVVAALGVVVEADGQAVTQLPSFSQLLQGSAVARLEADTDAVALIAGQAVDNGAGLQMVGNVRRPTAELAAVDSAILTQGSVDPQIAALALTLGTATPVIGKDEAGSRENTSAEVDADLGSASDALDAEMAEMIWPGLALFMDSRAALQGANAAKFEPSVQPVTTGANATGNVIRARIGAGSTLSQVLVAGDQPQSGTTIADTMGRTLIDSSAASSLVASKDAVVGVADDGGDFKPSLTNLTTGTFFGSKRTLPDSAVVNALQPSPTNSPELAPVIEAAPSSLFSSIRFTVQDAARPTVLSVDRPELVSMAVTPPVTERGKTAPVATPIEPPDLAPVVAKTSPSTPAVPLVKPDGDRTPSATVILPVTATVKAAPVAAPIEPPGSAPVMAKTSPATPTVPPVQQVDRASSAPAIPPVTERGKTAPVAAPVEQSEATLPVAKTSPAPPAVPLVKPDGDRTPSATVILPVTATVKAAPVAAPIEQPDLAPVVAKTSSSTPAVPLVKPDGDRTPSATVIAPVTATMKTAPVATPIEPPDLAPVVAKTSSSTPAVPPVKPDGDRTPSATVIAPVTATMKTAPVATPIEPPELAPVVAKTSSSTPAVPLVKPDGDRTPSATVILPVTERGKTAPVATLPVAKTPPAPPAVPPVKPDGDRTPSATVIAPVTATMKTAPVATPIEPPELAPVVAKTSSSTPAVPLVKPDGDRTPSATVILPVTERGKTAPVATLPVAKTPPAPPAVPPDGDRTPSATVIAPVTERGKTAPVATSVEQPEATLPVAKTSPATPAVPPVKPADRTPSAAVTPPVTETVKTAPVATPVEQPDSAPVMAKTPPAPPAVPPVNPGDRTPSAAVIAPVTETVKTAPVATSVEQPDSAPVMAKTSPAPPAVPPVNLGDRTPSATVILPVTATVKAAPVATPVEQPEATLSVAKTPPATPAVPPVNLGDRIPSAAVIAPVTETVKTAPVATSVEQPEATLPVAKTSSSTPAVPPVKPDGDRTPSATVIAPVTATAKTAPVATPVEQPDSAPVMAKTPPAPPAVPPVKPDGDRTPSATVIAPVTATMTTAPVAAPIEQPGSASPVAKMPVANPIILPVVRLDQAPMAITPATETVSRLAATVAMATPVIDVTKKMIDGQQDRTPIRLDAPSATLSSALSASTAIGVTAAAVAESANVIQDEVATNRGAPQIMGGRPLQPLPADPFGAIEPTVTVQTDFAVKTLADEAQPASVPVTISPNFASPDQSTASTIHDSPLLVAAAAQARPQSAKELDAESPQLAKPSAESVVIRTTESTIPAASGSAITPPASVTSAAPSRPEATTTPTFAQTTPGTVDFQQSNWERALSHQLNWMVNNRTQEAQIRVNPPDLGPIEVRMSLQQNQTNVAFVCHESAVREAIENALPRLREMLNGQGILLNQAQVSDQSLARQQSGFGEQPYSRRESGSETATPDRNPVTDADEQPLRHRRSLGMVDHYV